MSARSKPKREDEVSAESEREASELPEGWHYLKLFDVCRPTQWTTISTKELTPQGYPVYGANGQIGFYPEYNHEHPTILITCRGATCGRINISEPQSYVNGNAMALDHLAESVVLLKFAAYALELRGLDDTITGSAQPQITRTSLEVVSLPIPPLAEQRRIVAKLELLLGKVSSSRQRLSRVSGLLKRFRQSVLAAACSGKLTTDWREENDDVEPATELLGRLQMERQKIWASSYPTRKYQEPDRLEDDDLETIPDSWLWTNFDHCASEITVGHVGPMKDRYVDSGVAFLRSQNVRPLRFDPIGLVRIPKDFQAELTKSRLVGGEILVVRSGANTGDCCVFPRGMEVANCADLVITRPLSGLCAEFGAMYVASPIGQAAIGLRQTGIAQPHFNIGAMRVKPFPLPPLSEQQEIVRRVEKLFAFADQIESRLKQAQTHVDRLTQSLLAKAFRGELVPQNSSEVPASVLLDHLRAERESMNRKTSKKVN